MAGRILTMQRQARELGRLRAGVVEVGANGRSFPKRSKHWIITSHQRAYLDVAAELWGGNVAEWLPQGAKDKAWRLITTVEAIDAILPPGDPLSQYYEMWSKGGCQRRCDGETEQLSGKGCLCRAQFGDEFHLQPPENACRPHTRLNVVLPDIPDLGVWRMETKGYYAANEIAASIDLIRSATGAQAMVPVRLRIEPRKRVAQGKTKQYPVIVVEIRGATAGQILGGVVPTAAVGGGEQRQAIESGPAEPKPDAQRVIALVRLANTPEALRALGEMAAAVADDDPNLPALQVEWKRRMQHFQDAAQPATQESAVEEPDADAVWAQIMAVVPGGWGTDGLEERVIAHLGKPSIDASGTELARFLAAVKSGEVQ